MTSSAPIRWQISAFSGLDTTQTGVAPPLRASWVAYEPRPPDAPQISTMSPCFIWAPWCETSCRYAVELTSPGEAASSQVRWSGFGISWFALTIGHLGQAAEVGLEAPDPLLRIEHGVVVAGRVLQFDAQAVRDHLVTRLPLGHRRADPQYHAGRVRADHVVRLVVLAR